MKNARVTTVAGVMDREGIHERPLSTMRGHDVIPIDPTKSFQSILGFGAAFTEAACYVLGQMPSDQQSWLFGQLFGNKGAKLNMGRLSVGASDYSRACFSYDDVVNDTSLEHFSTARDEQWVIPMVRRALEEAPSLFLLASPWSPPGWMKTGGSMRGGWMREEFLDVYAEYLVRYLDAYRTSGIPIQALTVQNEVETDQLGKMPAAYWHPDLESRFVTQYLVPKLRTMDWRVMIWILDHNYAMWPRVDWMLNDGHLREAIDGVAFHGYQGEASMMTLLRDRHPTIHVYWTEGGPDLGPGYLTDWCRWGETFTGALRNWARCIVGWNLASDEQGGPNIGPFSCAGMVTVQQESHQVSFSGQYWAMRHFSSYVERGAQRIESTELEGIANVAFRNPNGDIVLVVTNSARTGRDLQIQSGDHRVGVRLEPMSMTTMVFD